MLYRLIFVSLFSFILLAAVFGQSVPKNESTENSERAPEIKKNPRPESNQPKEFFDGVDAKGLAEKCAVFDTELGKIGMEFFPESAPETVRNFLNLIQLQIFDTTAFNRIVPDFIIQGGSISTRESRTPEMSERARQKIPDEPSLIKHERGIVSMARSDEPNSASSNFFILLSSGEHLDGNFAAFGRITSGMEVVEAINKMPFENEKPEKPVKIIKVIITSCPAQMKQ